MTDIQVSVTDAFQQSQTGVTGHKTLALKLKHLFLKIREEPSKYHLFVVSFSRCVDKLLAAGKRDKCAENVIEFLVEFAKLLVPSDRDGKENQNDTEGDDAEDEQTIEFFEGLIERYMDGFESRLSQVRFRCVVLVSSLVPLIPLNETLLNRLEDNAIKRLLDSDTKVRVNAVLLVSRFELTEKTSQALVRAMRHDPSPEVRLAAIYNIAHGNQRLSELVCERVNDTSTQIRLAMYRKVLPSIDFRTLSISTRERIVKAGLNDRDEQVKKEASSLVALRWVSMSDNNVELVLQRLDVIGRTEIADLMLQAFFALRRDVVDKLEFDDNFFKHIWVEDTVLLRGFLDFCIREKLDELKEAKMPDLTTIATCIERLWENFEDPLVYEKAESPEDAEELRVSLPFMVDQLLDVASKYDLSDEASRQRISQVTNRIAMSDTAPTYQSMAHIVAIQRMLNSSDTALVSWAFETLEATPAMSSQITSDTVIVSGLLRGLSLFNSVLAKVKSPDIVSYLPSIYTTYVHQALQSPVIEISILGLKCLGLACLLDYKFAASHIDHFIQYVTTNRNVENFEFSEVVSFCVHAITDMLLQYESPAEGLENNSNLPETSSAETSRTATGTGLPKEEIIELFCTLLNSPAKATQHAAALSLAKLTLSRISRDRPHILRLLLVYYFSCADAPTEQMDGHSVEHTGLIQQQLLLFFKAQSLYDDCRVDIARTFLAAFKDYAEWRIHHPKAVSLGDFVRQVISFSSNTEKADASPKNVNAHSIMAISLLELLGDTEETTTKRSLASTLKLLELDSASKQELGVIKQLLVTKFDAENSTGGLVNKDLEAFIQKIDDLYKNAEEEEPSDFERNGDSGSVASIVKVEAAGDSDNAPIDSPLRASTPQDEVSI